MTYLFLRLLRDDLKEYTYAARLAGVAYSVTPRTNALLVSTSSPTPPPSGLAILDACGESQRGGVLVLEVVVVVRRGLGAEGFVFKGWGEALSLRLLPLE